MVFDAPRTAALQSCLLRTEGSGLGSLAEPPVLGVKPVVKRVNSVSKDESSVKFIIGSDSSDDEDDPWQDYQRRQQTRKRQKSEGSSGVSTHMSTSMSNTSSSFVSNFSGDIDEEGELESVDGDNVGDKCSSSVDATSALFNTLAPTSVVVEQSNVLRPSSSIQGPHSHEMSYLSVNPASALKIKWPYFVCGEFMVFHIPKTPKAIAIQDALITLLEYGEKHFQCSYAVVLIEKGRADKTSFERTFTFLGFRFASSNELSECLKDFTKDYVVMMSDFSDLCDDSDQESLFEE